jgi:hypothetical protein
MSTQGCSDSFSNREGSLRALATLDSPREQEQGVTDQISNKAYQTKQTQRILFDLQQ